MADIAGLLFDKDGTLFDFQETWGGWCRRLLSDLAGGDDRLTARLAESVGYDIATGRFRRGSVVVADTAEAIAAVLLPHLEGWGQAGLVDHMNRLSAEAPQVEVVPLLPLFDRLRDVGLTLGLATNDAEAPARAHLAAAGLDGHFAFVAGADSGHGAKPGPGPLLAFAAATGLPPARVAMVGDSAHDLVAGRAAGMVCVAVQSGMTAPDVLAPLADVMLPDIGALPGWIESLG
ncbi:HAD family hydrolase [Oceaniglobus roseus]|uniref:HAD family hydrolase n=1 Tax=Oceaniglobus roseus TaxID=1737570 RepID=UPI000C7EFFCA|nr:HAD family hydrolase [Kandeliimicrobium roseum]